MTETLQAQDDRRKSVVEKNDQRTDIDETMGEGGGDEEEDGESEDDNEDGQGRGVSVTRSGTKRRKQSRFYFRTGVVVRTTTDIGREVVHSHFLKCHTDLNVKMRGLYNTVGTDQDPPHFLKLIILEEIHTPIH
jgi:hypothetical protein